ncbi:MAG: tyrosine-protein phosphatase [Acidimicrobiia bacterium]
MTNVRDLGGLITGDGRVTRSRVVLRGETPDELDARDVDDLVERVGVRLVIDLRMTHERVQRRSPLADAGVETLCMPLWDDPAISAGLRADPWLDDEAGAEKMAEFYLRVIDSIGSQACELLEALVSRPGAALLHCTGGKDRTGMMAALLLGAVGVENELIVRDYAATGLRLEALFARLSRLHGVSYPPADVPRFALRSDPRTMQMVLASLIERHGGVRQWWLAQGIGDGTLAAWDRRFTA